MKKEYGIFVVILFVLTVVYLSGFGNGFFLDPFKGQNIYMTGAGHLLNVMNMLIWGGIMWHCWSMARDKNRNPWIWLAASFLAGLIISGLILRTLVLGVLAYLKKAPEKASA
ncbi:membrane hypothetical protein [Candidatus Desulfarcum epimagneticum]|uniref:Uncharacterized protein n=1 Tax=uncultured Desulfobacteraceae bacterium TaxID=218296 RepID=A0A484HFL7_9BACT|nr:membrane hypothetical protein [uncultured Desulfobacteraceae bacterium]